MTANTAAKKMRPYTEVLAKRCSDADISRVVATLLTSCFGFTGIIQKASLPEHTAKAFAKTVHLGACCMNSNNWLHP
jgi:hypothetical protein